jgi:hypothetical protein
VIEHYRQAVPAIRYEAELVDSADDVPLPDEWVEALSKVASVAGAHPGAVRPIRLAATTRRAMNDEADRKDEVWVEDVV